MAGGSPAPRESSPERFEGVGDSLRQESRLNQVNSFCGGSHRVPVGMSKFLS